MRRGKRGRGTRGAERTVEPERPRERAVVAPHEADDGGGDAHIETQVREVGGEGTGGLA